MQTGSGEYAGPDLISKAVTTILAGSLTPSIRK
jgi:hypothetical protein